MTDQPWLSIVTVVKDDSIGLARTLASLSEQHLLGCEYLVIDGSTDRSAVLDLLEASGLSHSYTWQEPCGIYAAMNVGLDLAKGTYIYFLNAGDELLPNALTEIEAASMNGTASWLIAQIEVVADSGSRIVTPVWEFAAEQRAFFARGKFAPHQGTFARTRDLLTSGGFDLKFSIAADYAVFLKLTLQSTPLILPYPVARFYEGGASTQNWKASFREFHQARLEILKPQGFSALIERFHTARQFLAVALYRGVWARYFVRG